MFGIYHNLTIEISKEKVFKAITSAEGLNKWWTKKAVGEPKVGAEYQFWFDPKHDWRAIVLHCIPGQSIHYEMIQSDKDWDSTQLRFELSVMETGTAIQFEHVGWRSVNDHFRRTSFCWAIYLNTLKQYLEGS